MLGHRILEDLGQAAGRPASYRRLEGVLYRLVQVTHAGAVQGRDKVDVGEVDEEQPALQLDLHEITFARGHAIPFVQGDHQRATRLQGKPEQVEVVVDHPSPASMKKIN